MSEQMQQAVGLRPYDSGPWKAWQSYSNALEDYVAQLEAQVEARDRALEFVVDKYLATIDMQVWAEIDALLENL